MQKLIELITLKENKEDGLIFLKPSITIAELEAFFEKEKNGDKENYIAGYLDNGYYEGAEEDAAKLWEETYGFNYNETFNTKEK